MFRNHGHACACSGPPISRARCQEGLDWWVRGGGRSTAPMAHIKCHAACARPTRRSSAPLCGAWGWGCSPPSPAGYLGVAPPRQPPAGANTQARWPMAAGIFFVPAPRPHSTPRAGMQACLCQHPRVSLWDAPQGPRRFSPRRTTLSRRAVGRTCMMCALQGWGPFMGTGPTSVGIFIPSPSPFFPALGEALRFGKPLLSAVLSGGFVPLSKR